MWNRVKKNRLEFPPSNSAPKYASLIFSKLYVYAGKIEGDKFAF